MRKPLRTTLHSLQNSVINSLEELKSRAHTGVDANGALYQIQDNNKSDFMHKYMQVLITPVIKELKSSIQKMKMLTESLDLSKVFHVWLC